MLREQLALKKVFGSPIAVTPNGRRLALVDDTAASLWDLADPTAPVWSFAFPWNEKHTFIRVALSSGGTWLALTAPGNKSALVTRTESAAPPVMLPFDEALTRQHSPQMFTTLAFAPDATRLATGHHRTVGIWRVPEMQLERVLEHPHSWIVDQCFMPDSRRLLTGAGTQVCVWDVEQGKCELTFEHSDQVARISLTQDARWLACGLGSGHTAKDARDNQYEYRTQFVVWDLTRGEQVIQQPTDASATPHVAFVSQPPVLAVAVGQQLGLWSIPEGTLLESHRGFYNSLEGIGDYLFGSWAGRAVVLKYTQDH